MRTKTGGKPAFFFLLSFLAATTCLSAQERIEWEPVVGADHYLVEISQNGKLVLEVQSKESFIPLFLPPGYYDIRIKVIDSFGNAQSTDEISRLKISAPLIPFIIYVSPGVFHKNEKPVFFARVSGLLENEKQSTTFALESDEDRKIQLNWEISDSSKAAEGWIEISLSTDRRLPNVGSWHLTMSNPDGREDSLENALTIFQGSQPRIKTINPKEFVAGIPNAVLRIRAKDFSGDTTLLIDGPSEIPITKLNQGEKDVFEFSLNLRDASEGLYSISLLNPSGEIDTIPEGLKIHSPKMASSRKVKTLKIDDRKPRPQSEFPNAIYGGWKPIIRTSDTGLESFFDPSSQVVFQPGYLGFTLGYSRDIENDLLRRVPYLDDVEWYFLASYSNSKLIDAEPSDLLPSPFPSPLDDFGLVQNHHSLAFLFGVSYVTWFDSPLNLLAQIGLGIGVMLREYSGPELSPIPGLPPDAGPDMPEFVYPKNSTSFIMSFDLGFRWDITPQLFVNTTANAMLKNEIDKNDEWSFQPKIEGGWRW
ncbi:hypothetical protein S1OALGB6SA_527 [Olavius algarvensis spirochete endosymbiont]|uniref:hypothetical protein n=1 Tax=Olavius algarvensis spirochete endosymbiont TaxID=260710 RepID=UPI000F0E4EE7|nr:hypothetical protein [Olavius algarvensis spirochete endosymbiont]CAD7840986.1 MAG: hypothetical protein [Olavius algarvensis spirochete endosymbiont]VDA99459.1 hypothetical protein S1OALGB6SA_527 [Olavius algarvensis spirochete endosymbiont]